MYKKIKETAEWLRQRMPSAPTTAIVLGSGLGELAKRIERLKTFPYSEIPNFPVSTVEGHTGELIFGKLGGVDVMAMEGRFHYYEGWTMQEVTFPVRVMYELGIKTLFVSNAAGGTNPNFKIGDLMIITDHINYMPENPLHGPNIPPGPRFPDMGEAYSKKLIARADEISEKHGIKVQHGVYVYARQYQGKTVLVMLNGTNKAVDLPLSYYQELLKNVRSGKDILSGRTVQFGETLSMASRESLVIEL